MSGRATFGGQRRARPLAAHAVTVPGAAVPVSGRHVESGGCHDQTMENRTGTLIASDGRVLAWVDGGDRTGYPVIGLHGPVAHGRFLAAVIPTATVVETAEGGHLPSDPCDEILATHRWLRTATRSAEGS